MKRILCWIFGHKYRTWTGKDGVRTVGTICYRCRHCEGGCGEEAEGLNQEEVKGLNRVKEIMRMAHNLNWVYPPNETSYPFMQLSEVEKCMLAMYNDFDLNRMRNWVEETQSSEQDKEAEGG